jgi:hypothetical protein
MLGSCCYVYALTDSRERRRMPQLLNSRALYVCVYNMYAYRSMAPERPGSDDERCGTTMVLHANGVTVPMVRQPLVLTGDQLKVCSLYCGSAV